MHSGRLTVLYAEVSVSTPDKAGGMLELIISRYFLFRIYLGSIPNPSAVHMM